MFKRILMIMLLALAPLAVQAQEVYEAGKDYDIINPAIRASDMSKIETAEFFWYGCGHCYTFEPMLAQWKKTLADDVSFRGVPAMWGGAMELHAKAFYAARALDVAEKMDQAMFQALNVDRKPLRSDKEIAQLFVANGVAEEDFYKAYNSFGVSSQVRQANSIARAAKISGTPALMVSGKYMISPRKAGSTANMLKIADYLIEKERAAKGS
ncbi:MAG: thiol:disulfide interchange protein DsbA/DsbL [Halioglobus sp.]|jgi:protein dithiol oxidoreductase (disulfide-forming)|nr:putative DSBA-like thioredoxin domain protein [marine gamma proteobacterium HTCC2148]MBT7719482.1 thiol:disulfide interchange protein DsbA/DsbL [Halieaceae bacterium]MDG1390314.1 thiol:disulfide interchange protein DsbA/DsbL [Halioglobus sp.]MDG2327454.1 thiol:disulfide interchange protein DsbA/DsbL [Halioglobus sp.]